MDSLSVAPMFSVIFLWREVLNMDTGFLVESGSGFFTLLLLNTGSGHSEMDPEDDNNNPSKISTVHQTYFFSVYFNNL